MFSLVLAGFVNSDINPTVRYEAFCTVKTLCITYFTGNKSCGSIPIPGTVSRFGHSSSTNSFI